SEGNCGSNVIIARTPRLLNNFTPSLGCALSVFLGFIGAFPSHWIKYLAREVLPQHLDGEIPSHRHTNGAAWTVCRDHLIKNRRRSGMLQLNGCVLILRGKSQFQFGCHSWP